MIRIYIVVEGQTEEGFVEEILRPALNARGIQPSACLIGRPGQKGGRVTYARVRGDVIRLLKQDRNAYCSTMLDFYGLGGGFPATPLPSNLLNIQKVERMELAMNADLVAELGESLRTDLRLEGLRA